MNDIGDVGLFDGAREKTAALHFAAPARSPRFMSRLSISALLLSTCLGCISAHAMEKPPAKGTAPKSSKLVITGSDTMAPMVASAAKRFSTLHPGIQIEVRTGGSGRAIDDVRKGGADIGMVSRALTDKESGLWSFAVARDGICLIVHKTNPVRSLTKRQVSEIYTGKINNWSTVGGKNAPILAPIISEGLGSSDFFMRYFGLKYADVKAPIVVSGNAERVKALIENPNGIAYMSVGAAQQQVDSGASIKMLPTDGVAATTKNIHSGNYPLSRPLLLLTKELPTGLAKEFITFVLSSQVTDIVLQHEFVPYRD